jgi:metal-dependent amidase/aminoacylase/carboxypeptidase family protein
MDETWREQAIVILKKQVLNIVESFGAHAEIEISRGYPCLINDEFLTNKAKEKLINVLGEENVEELPIRLTSEDFSFYSQKIPVCFLRLGVGNNKKSTNYGVHHPMFDIDNQSIKTGMKTLSNLVLN